MIRLPPTKIELTARDLEWHGQRLEHRMETNQPLPKRFRGKHQFEFHFPDEQPSATPPFELSSLFMSSEETTNDSVRSSKGKARQEADRVSGDGRKVRVDSDGSCEDQCPSSISPSKDSSRAKEYHEQQEPDVSNWSKLEDVAIHESIASSYSHSHQTGQNSRSLSHQSSFLEDIERLRLDSDDEQGENVQTPDRRGSKHPLQPTLQASDEHATPSSEPQLPHPFSATPRNVSWNYSLPSSPILPRYSLSSDRSAPSARGHGFSSSPGGSHADNAQSTASPSTSTQFNSTPPPMQAPRTPPRSAIRVYNDALPPLSQPQTPLGLPRNGIAPMLPPGVYTTPRPSTFAGLGRDESIYGTPSRATAARSNWLSPRLSPVIMPGDGTVDQENASRHAELDRRRRIAREQRLGYGTGNAGELDRTPPRQPGRRP